MKDTETKEKFIQLRAENFNGIRGMLIPVDEGLSTDCIPNVSCCRNKTKGGYREHKWLSGVQVRLRMRDI